MKRFFITLLAVSMLSVIAQADTTLKGINQITPCETSKEGSSDITTYNPVLDISIPHDFSGGGHSNAIASDGNYYYVINGGASGYGRIFRYDMSGNFVSSAPTYLDGREVFYNPDDGNVYIKIFGEDLYTVNPVTGDTSLVHSGIFHHLQSRIAFDAATQLMYEHADGTVYVVELSTGDLISTMTGFTYGSHGYNYAIATNGVHLFTWEDGGIVHAYEFNGTYVESFTLPNGTYGWTLDVCNHRIWAADDADGGIGTWYGHINAGLPVVSIDMVPHNPPINILPGNSFDFTGTLTNNTDSPQSVDVAIYLKDVPWGGFYGPILMFHDIPLDPYEVYIDSNASQFVPGYAVLGDYTYIAYCGDFPATPYDSAWFDFTITDGSGGYNVGIVCSDFDDDWSEVHDLLLTNGEINSANFVDARYTTPTLANLLAFDVVIVWSNLEFANNIALGDVLADYVEAGGGVVTAEFCHLDGSFSLAGRYMNDYSPMGTGPTGFVTTNLVVDDAGHPIMAGVTTGTEYFDFNAPLQGNTNMVQHWDNGYNGVVVNTDVPRCVAMNDNFGTSYRQWTGDIGQMMV
ncbi:MAG: hypothetical protein GY855_14315, partial [candidate division Zixibacteria bacterium]|nr:hypothetical protein [candidate division Zixibacteria bacterium]